MYYNTNNSTGEVLKKEWINAQAQSGRVLKIFLTYPSTGFSVDRIIAGYKYHYGKDLNKSSCARCITDLCEQGYLIKMSKEEMTINTEGKKVHRWIYSSKNINWITNKNKKNVRSKSKRK